MAKAEVYEGTLEEITARYGKELSGLRLKVIVDAAAASGNGTTNRFYETTTPEQWIEALRNWAASHDPNRPLLSDEAFDRASIYEGREE